MRPRIWVVVAGLAAATFAVMGGLRTARVRELVLRAGAPGFDVILITLDTTRADRLGCYGHQAPTSPHLDGLARDGVLFRNAYSHAPLTLPSHASIMTGLTPSHHGIHDNGGFALTDGIPTLAESFVEAGYRTGAFVSAFVLERRFGLSRGFGTYEDDVHVGGRDNLLASIPGDAVVDRAVRWLRVPDPRPVLAWVHLYDPHTPYEPPEPFAKKLEGRPYEGEIAFMDAQVGRLLDEIRARRRRTLVVVLGDHGESLGEHGEPSHGYFIYGATQRVPFIMSFPERLGRGIEIETTVRAVDLMPTVLDLAGLEVPDGIDGASLIPVLAGAELEQSGPAYLEAYQPRLWFGANELLGVRSGPWLYIRSPAAELYHVATDPKELRNLVGSMPDVANRLDQQLESMLGSRDPLAARSVIDPDTARRLQALGYAGGASPDSVETDGQDLSDAKDNLRLLVWHSEARELEVEEKFDEALLVYEDILELNPRSAATKHQIGMLLLKLERYERALAILSELHEEYPDWAGYAVGAAQALLRQDRPAEALSLLDASAADFSNSSDVHEMRGLALTRLGRFEEAEEALREATRLAPRQLVVQLSLARLLLRQERVGEAATILEAVVGASPHSSEAEEAAEILVPLASHFLVTDALDDASASYEAALEAGSSSELIYLNLALSYFRRARLDEAMRVLKDGLQAFPDSAALKARHRDLLSEAGVPDEPERER